MAYGKIDPNYGKQSLKKEKNTNYNSEIKIGVQVDEEERAENPHGREAFADRSLEVKNPAGGLVTEAELPIDKKEESEETEIERWDRYIHSVFRGQYRVDRTYQSGTDRMPGLMGSGGFAKVFCVKNSSGDRFAMKVVYKSDFKTVEEEYNRQESLSKDAATSGFVVRLYGLDKTDNLERYNEESGTISFMVMEMMDGTLHDILQNSDHKKLNIVAAVRLMADICEKVRILHRTGFVHNDIKPKNIFYKKSRFITSSQSYLIGDFGITKEMDETRSTMAGSRDYYFLPDDFLNPARDVYSLGIMMMELLGVNPKDYSPTVRNNVSTLWSEEDVDPEIREICRSACKPTFTERISLDDFIDAIHSWLSRHKDEADFLDKKSSELLKTGLRILSEDKDGSDLLRAAKYFESAAGKGSGEAYYILAKEARLKEFISGSPDDYLQKASELGFVKAINAVSVRKLKELGPSGDPDEIAVEVEKLRKIADNYLPACYNVAMLIKGHVTNASYEGEAEALLKKAASGGYEPAKAVYES